MIQGEDKNFTIRLGDNNKPQQETWTLTSTTAGTIILEVDGEPLFIDFTGHGCVNCREMEARVWSDPKVLRRLRNDFVMVALYVDDKTKLDEKYWYTSTYDNKIKKTIGKQNADFQITRYKNNAQPFYVILDQDEQLLARPLAYNLDIENFVKFIDKAKEEYYKRESLAKK